MISWDNLSKAKLKAIDCSANPMGGLLFSVGFVLRTRCFSSGGGWVLYAKCHTSHVQVPTVQTYLHMANTYVMYQRYHFEYKQVSYPNIVQRRLCITNKGFLQRSLVEIANYTVFCRRHLDPSLIVLWYSIFCVFYL